jgi:quercetin dioxygenase-like cupin family protein
MSKDGNMKVMRPESLPANPGSADYFTGIVRIAPLVQGEEPSCMTCGCVTFDPSARSAWHTHPKGQILIVTEGVGFVQEWGTPIQIIKKGDVIWTPADVKHWHGASSESSLTHIAIQETLNGKNIHWLEKVSDEHYSAALAKERSKGVKS